MFNAYGARKAFMQEIQDLPAGTLDGPASGFPGRFQPAFFSSGFFSAGSFF
jgi:hypothetical protein